MRATWPARVASGSRSARSCNGWCRTAERQEVSFVSFQCSAADGEEGYPGNLALKAIYTLSGNTLALTLDAHTTKPTVCNLTKHAYWNLAGSGSVLGHELQFMGEHYFQLSKLLLPLGRIEDTAGTRFDFRSPHVIRAVHDFCTELREPRGEMKHGLTLREPLSGRRMEVWTTEGCMQTYTAIHWIPAMTGHMGLLQQSAALAIEPQNVAASLPGTFWRCLSWSRSF